MLKHVTLTAAIILAGTWVVSFGTGGYPTVLPFYLQVAPWWHITLFVLWFGVQLWANVLFVIWLYERPLRQRRKELANQPPQHAG
jgi:hypothetical protein